MLLSKLFIEKVTKKNLRCCDIYHPGESCLNYNFYLLKNTWMHCAKFYTPLFLLPLMKKINNLQWTEAKKSLEVYIHMVVASTVISSLTISCSCFLSKHLGRIYLSTLIYVPCFIMSMLYMPFMDQRVATIYGNIMLTVNLEALIREGRTTFWRILRDSKWMQTVLFMLSSSIVIDTMSSMPTSIFWFINPHTDKVSANKQFVGATVLPINANNCKHEQNCDQHIWRGLKRVSMTMIGFETIRIIFSNLKIIAAHPSKLKNLLKAKMNFPIIAMVSGYTVIFEISKCLQNRLHKIPSSPTSRYSNLISGFLCGSVFWLNPDLSLLCHGLSAAIQLTFQNYFMDWLKSKNETIADYAASFPWSKFFFTMSMGYTLHLIILYPTLCSRLMHKISDAVLSCRTQMVAFIDVLSFACIFTSSLRVGVAVGSKHG